MTVYSVAIAWHRESVESELVRQIIEGNVEQRRQALEELLERNESRVIRTYAKLAEGDPSSAAPAWTEILRSFVVS